MSVRDYLEMTQTEFIFRTWGGKRRGAGRKATPGRPVEMPHVERPAHQRYHPLHLTLRVALRCLRRQIVFQRVIAAMRAVNRNRGERFRIVEFSIQWDHLHLIVEALDKQNIANGVRALCARIAYAVNRLLGRRGKLFPQRYHQHVLTTPRAVRAALIYVLGNFRKHFTEEARLGYPIDPLSSALYFTGFSGIFAINAGRVGDDIPVLPAQTWLLTRGWRKHGLIPAQAAPALQKH